ncbi:MAG: XRE family transcriptional regulator [Nitrospirae bacterium]|nr:MAG: XRE family transcriptional regulator [Nitrospirota bacterium]
MSEIAAYVKAIKERYHLRSDYALAEKLGIAQPDANLLRRGRKIPKPELCIKMAKLLDKNPVELLLVAQKDKAPVTAKEYWSLALTAVDVMLHVPKSPKYIPRKVEAIGRELRQLESQTLIYEGVAANTEAVRLMETVEHTVDAMMEQWNIWKKGEALYPNYLLANQEAVQRGVLIRRLLVLTTEQMSQDALVDDALHVMEDQRRAGIKVFYAFREELNRSPVFRRLQEEYRKQGAAPNINAAVYDGEILIFARSYREVPLGMIGRPLPVTMIHQLEITWKPELLRDLNPAPLFDMTRYVFEYDGADSFLLQLSRHYPSGRSAGS